MKKKRGSEIANKYTSLLGYWPLTKRWLKEYFEEDNDSREDFGSDHCLDIAKEHLTPEAQYISLNRPRYPFLLERLIPPICRNSLAQL